jgi:hypothetical protein
MTNKISLPRGLMQQVVKECDLCYRTVKNAFDKKENEIPSTNDWKIKNKTLLVAQQLGIPETIYSSWFKF